VTRLICLLLVVMTGCATAGHPSPAEYIAGIEGPPYPIPEGCAQPLDTPVSFAENEAEWILYEGSLWTRLGDNMYLPEFYDPDEAPAGYLKAKMYWPDRWEATVELVVACNHFAEPADVAGLLGDAISIVAEGHQSFGAFVDSFGFDDAWLERSLAAAIVAQHPVGQVSEFRVEFVLIGYDIRWCDHRQEWHHCTKP